MKLILILSVLTLVGCQCEEDQACRTEKETARATAYVAGSAAVPPSATARATPPRVTVERIGVVRDSIAYGGDRGIYVIRDNATGQEFIGVSGVGIAETGRHTSGKTSKTDER